MDLESYDCKEDASKTCERLIQAWPTAWDLHVKPKKKRIHSGIYSATVMEVDIWLIFRECLLFGFSKENLITVRRSTRGTNY